jgi:hypothetical protein
MFGTHSVRVFLSDLCGLSERSERAREEACASRKDAETQRTYEELRNPGRLTGRNRSGLDSFLDSWLP